MDAPAANQTIAAKTDSKAAAAPPPAEASTAATVTKITTVQIALIVLGAMAFLYFARPVILPVVLACIAGMTLKPLIRWLSCCHILTPLSAAVVLYVLVAAIGIGFFQLCRPALTWMNEAPEHMSPVSELLTR